MRLLRRSGAILLHAWPQKLGALVLATLIWLFVNVNDTSITQRSLFVPITVEGLSQNSVVTGLPDFVEITVSGPSGQVDRLRPENFEAILDLNGQSGSFEVPIQVLSPQNIDLRRVNPGDVIGTVEGVIEKSVPVDPVILGDTPPDMRVTTTLEPSQVTVSARDSTLARVARVLAPVRPTADQVTVRPYAVDNEGRPVGGVSVQPETITVSIARQPVLMTREVAIDLATPSLPGFTVTARLEQSAATLVGPPSVLRELESVSGTVSLPTEEPEPGGYTLPVTLELPEGVYQANSVSASVRLSRPPIEP